MAELSDAKTLTEAMATILASMIGLATVATLLEPEEITKYTEGQIDFQKLSAIMLSRIPLGGESSTVRLARAFGIRIPPEVIDRCFEALNMDGVPIDTWLSDLNDRVTALEDTINQPAQEGEV